MEIKHFSFSRSAESYNPDLGGFIRKLTPLALARLEAKRARFMSGFIPRLEIEANRGLPNDLSLLKELSVHHFDALAAEILQTCKSDEEFREALAGDIPHFAHHAIDQSPILSKDMREELVNAFAMACLGENAWG